MPPSKNLLILMSDEHNPKIMGCAGNDIIHTPNLDALARRGTRFTGAYTASPICVPARGVRDGQVHPPNRILGQR